MQPNHLIASLGWAKVKRESILERLSVTTSKCPSLYLWVPNSSSTAVTSSAARRWMLDMIVDRGGATAVSVPPAAGSVAWPAGRCSWSKNQPADRQGEH
jgi:hypothetical protein